jgi:hypothetical protein
VSTTSPFCCDDVSMKNRFRSNFSRRPKRSFQGMSTFSWLAQLYRAAYYSGRRCSSRPASLCLSHSQMDLPHAAYVMESITLTNSARPPLVIGLVAYVVKLGTLACDVRRFARHACASSVMLITIS